LVSEPTERGKRSSEAALIGGLLFPCTDQQRETMAMSLGTIILIILVIALLGGFSGLGGGPFYGTGYYGGGGLGLVIVIVLILVLLGRL
jgi:hypothetical protein